MSWAPVDDLVAVHARVGVAWQELKGARLFITGATGFIGRGILESLRYADAAESLGISVTVLSRNPGAFAKVSSDLMAWERFTVLSGDVKSFSFPEGKFTHLIHAATEASQALNDRNPKEMFDTIVLGTQRVLDFAVKNDAVRVLNLSSGAVYGLQPWSITHIREDWHGSPDCTNPRNAYGEGKRAAEQLAAIYGKQFGLAVCTARVFALVGPHLPLDAHFAIGNFIRDAIAGSKIVVKSDGRACRSYLYTSDCTAALLLMLLRGPRGSTFNLGSEDAVSIHELAETISTTLNANGYEILGRPDEGWNPGRYVPDISKYVAEFGSLQSVPLVEAIRRTALWNGWKPWR